MSEVDAVILWVDGNDPVLAAKRARYAGAFEQGRDDLAAPTRFADVGEIHWCVRSICRFAPWVRKIWIVTDGQDPHVDSTIPAGCRGSDGFPSVRTSIPVEVVDHSVIYRGCEEYLPVFNSISIESMIWRIPGLSERFLYFNDDLILAAPVTEEDFFTPDGRAVFYGSYAITPWIRLLRDLKPCGRLRAWLLRGLKPCGRSRAGLLRDLKPCGCSRAGLSGKSASPDGGASREASASPDEVAPCAVSVSPDEVASRAASVSRLRPTTVKHSLLQTIPVAVRLAPRLELPGAVGPRAAGAFAAGVGDSGLSRAEGAGLTCAAGAESPCAADTVAAAGRRRSPWLHSVRPGGRRRAPWLLRFAFPFPVHIPKAMFRSFYEAVDAAEPGLLARNASYRFRDLEQFRADELLPMILTRSGLCEVRPYKDVLFYFKPRKRAEGEDGIAYFEKKFSRFGVIPASESGDDSETGSCHQAVSCHQAAFYDSELDSREDSETGPCEVSESDSCRQATFSVSEFDSRETSETGPCEVSESASCRQAAFSVSEFDSRGGSESRSCHPTASSPVGYSDRVKFLCFNSLDQASPEVLSRVRRWVEARLSL